MDGIGTMMRARLALFGFAVSAIALVLAGCGGGDPPNPIAAAATAGAKVGYRGTVQTPALEKPNLTLTDTSEKPFDIRKETAGTVTFLYLGYTHCPDICPTHMANIAAALKELSPQDQAKVRVVFVTADPERDTPAVLRTWLDLFDTRFVGLVPTAEQLKQLTEFLMMPPIERDPLGNGNYSVSHAAYVLGYTPDNLSHLVYRLHTTRADWIADLKVLTGVGWATK